jgi:tetratricopeptide (TPR) repeat protein
VQAQRSFRLQEYQDAAKSYEIMLKNSYFPPEEVVQNYAQTLFLAKDTSNAKKKYLQLVALQKSTGSSTTYAQLGLLACWQKDSGQALILFRQALKINPENEIARFNYELLRTLYNPKSAKQQDKQKKQNQVTPPPPKSNEQMMSPEKSEDKRQLLKTLKNYGLSLEGAMMILDGMKNSEVQYIQQGHIHTKNKSSVLKQDW